jgi:hypothetical protein
MEAFSVFMDEGAKLFATDEVMEEE